MAVVLRVRKVLTYHGRLARANGAVVDDWQYQTAQH